MNRLKITLHSAKEHLKGFWKDESGAEMLENGAGIVIAVGLIAAFAGIAWMVKQNLTKAEDQANNEFQQALDTARSGQGSPTPTGP